MWNRIFTMYIKSTIRYSATPQSTIPVVEKLSIASIRTYNIIELQRRAITTLQPIALLLPPPNLLPK